MERCTSIDGGDSKCLLRLRLGLMALAMEIPLIPLSIFAIYPIGRTSVMLCAVYMRQAFGELLSAARLYDSRFLREKTPPKGFHHTICSCAAAPFQTARSKTRLRCFA